ncbi:transcriptional regulator [Amylibacter ulvae]|uniref:Transcriptional regulator n=1 Tax=Paramylibacter ulvae TaxID=1651968 RepID=A0ABQ3CWS5_9RHOB|nr:GntR family transcriptional regulator [Amylibacter ulvae]GHA44779.1 transcriptional regulator [Amylibacter ulvae]
MADSSEKISNGQLAYDKLHYAIASGALPPGSRIRETEAAALVGLSRTPVREAIRRLESEGIVEHQPRIGAVVKSLSHQEIVELYEMRIVLEKTAARMAAKHTSSAEIGELKDLNAAMLNAAKDAATVSRLNEQFHRCIFNAARNRYLLASFQALANAVLVLGPTTLENTDRVKLVCKQHDDIIAALEAGDEKRAATAAGDHIETSLSYRLKSLRI